VHTVGRHLLVELHDCDKTLLDDLDAVKTTIREAAKRAGASIVSESFHRFAPQGVSASVLIAESHLSIHTWPEAGYAAADLYTCGELNPMPGVEYLAEAFRATTFSCAEIIRGLDDDIRTAALPESPGRHNIAALSIVTELL